MSHLLLSHLSKDNNDPSLAQMLFEKHALNTKIIVASRYEATAVYSISAVSATAKSAPTFRPVQMVLF